MELVAQKKGIVTLIIENEEKYIIFNILRRHIIKETGILHRGKIENNKYECDPYVFTLFFREYTFGST